VRATASIIVILFAICTARAAERITSDNFERFYELAQPTAEEQSWRQIPWFTSLWEARIKANEVGKPILLWEMDGNPLGCT
jgi:hypothetical protein